MKILVCTDGSEKSAKAVEKAAFIAEKLDEVDVTIIYVHHLETFLTTHADGFVSGEVLQQIYGEKKEKGKKILDEAKKVFEGKNVQAKTLLTEGHPAATIIEAAAKGKFDLVVMGNRGLGGLRKWLLGSVSNAVAQEVESTVMIVK